MATKPTDDFTWAGSATPTRVVEPAASRAAGWSYKQAVPSDGFNWIQRMIGRWLGFFSALFDTDGNLTMDATNSHLEVTVDTPSASTWTFVGTDVTVSSDKLAAFSYTVGTNGRLYLSADNPSSSTLFFESSGGGGGIIRTNQFYAGEQILFQRVSGGGGPVTVASFNEFNSTLKVEDGTGHHGLEFSGSGKESTLIADMMKVTAAEPPTSLDNRLTLTGASVVTAKLLCRATVNGSGTITSGDVSVLQSANVDAGTITVSAGSLSFSLLRSLATNSRAFTVEVIRESGFSGEIFMVDQAGLQTTGSSFFATPRYTSTAGGAAWGTLLDRTGLTPGDEILISIIVH